MGPSMEQKQYTRTARLTGLARAARHGGGFSAGAAYMNSVTPEGQEGAWAKLVSIVGTRVNCRQFPIGVLEGCAALVGSRVPVSLCTPSESVKKAVGEAAFACAHCPGLQETSPHNYQSWHPPSVAVVTGKTS